MANVSGIEAQARNVTNDKWIFQFRAVVVCKRDYYYYYYYYYC